jgi:pimeloyl-ACP methyl ester carboxylesterase
MDSFSRDGLHFDVLDAGPADGDPVVLLHGFPQDAHSWDGVRRVLHEAGLRTLAPLQRGYSETARPRARSDYAVRECALDVLALLDTAGIERAHMVGHDWGGMVAWALGGLFPDRVRTLVSLSTPHPAALAHAFTHSTQGLRSWYMAFFQLPLLPELAAGRTLGQTLRRSGLPAEHAARYASRMALPGALTGALNWYRGMPTSMRDPVPPVRVPTTYVWGRDDFALGRTAAEATAQFVQGPYRFVELDAGHWLPETRTAEVSAVLLDRFHHPG